MHVLVTGGRGFLGSHVVDVLVERGHSVTVVDDGSTVPSMLVPGALLLPLTLGKEFCADGAGRCQVVYRESSRRLVDLAPDAVIHCAAYADISNNWNVDAERDHLYANNIDATIEVLESFTCPIVFASTAALYDDEIPKCTSPYSATKLAGEALCFAYGHRRMQRIAVARMVSLVGPRYHHGHIADFVRMAKAGKIVALSDGCAKKPNLHVRDAAEALVMMATSPDMAGVFALSSGEGWSCRDTVREMGDVEVEWPGNVLGWVGDPIFLREENDRIEADRPPGWVATRSIADGVRDSLTSLGWGT